ncbi:MAG: PorT family protein, partial [Pedobacter sp.]
MSSIGLRNFARPGTNVGVLLEYRLAPRWSVQTGIIQSTKIYRASATDYELSDYYKKGAYTIPQGADGQCKMLDIPLNIRYDILLRPRADGRLPNRWFITGGVTSYIIEREKYVYQYTGRQVNYKTVESLVIGNA